MKYTKYFGLMTKEQGRLNLPTMQFQRLMNIVHLEGVLFGLHKAKEANKDMQAYHKYDILILNENTKINELTGNLTTEMLEEISGLYEIDDNGHITYSRVIETENLTKDEMYSRALSYFIYNYNDANSVIQEQDKEDGRLIGKGIVKKVHTGVGMVVLVFDFWHILRIDIKENKFRALLTLTEYRTELSSLDGKTPPTISNTKISSQYPLNPKGPMKNFNGKAFFSTHNKAISILDAIEKSVKEGNTSKSVENNDW